LPPIHIEVSVLTSAAFSAVVFDLPQLYAKPSANDLLEALSTLKVGPTSFSQSRDDSHTVPSGNVSQYLTSIIASKLSWIEDEAARDSIWEEASARLSERSGRTGTFLAPPEAFHADI
jgi:hypothetical protein